MEMAKQIPANCLQRIKEKISSNVDEKMIFRVNSFPKGIFFITWGLGPFAGISYYYKIEFGEETYYCMIDTFLFGQIILQSHFYQKTQNGYVKMK